MPYVAESYIHEMDRKAFAAKIHTCQKDELYLVTPEYLTADGTNVI